MAEKKANPYILRSRVHKKNIVVIEIEKDIDSEMEKINELLLKQIYILVFFSPRCYHCVNMAGMINKEFKKYNESGVPIIAINVDIMSKIKNEKLKYITSLVKFMPYFLMVQHSKDRIYYEEYDSKYFADMLHHGSLL